MKRLLSLILALSMVFALVGCQKNDRDDDDEEDVDVEETLEEAEELVEEGDLKAAEKLLKKAIKNAEETEELEAYLEIVQAMMDGQEAGLTIATEDVTYSGQPDAQKNTETTVAPQTTTEAIAVPETTARPQYEEPARPTGGNVLNGFTSEQIYQINVFLSNFSEVSFDSYPCNDYEMVSFGYRYAKINNREVLYTKDYYYCIDRANMDSILRRFFDTTAYVSDPSTLFGPYYDTIQYSGGTYYFPAADGESCAYCSVATYMVSNGNGTYQVSFDVYAHQNPHESMSSYYRMTATQMAARGELQYLYSGTAVVRDYTRSSGVQSYQLISYSHN